MQVLNSSVARPWKLEQNTSGQASRQALTASRLWKLEQNNMTKKGPFFGPQNVRKSRRAKMGLPSTLTCCSKLESENKFKLSNFHFGRPKEPTPQVHKNPRKNTSFWRLRGVHFQTGGDCGKGTCPSAQQDGLISMRYKGGPNSVSKNHIKPHSPFKLRVEDGAWQIQDYWTRQGAEGGFCPHFPDCFTDW